jgi:mannosyltransferase OCH1-like enzyme
MIPRILHQIWLGDHPQHRLFVEWRARWQELHPTWEFREWDQGALEALGLHDPGMLACCCHNAQRANIWRLLVLRKLGGVYIDTDIEPIKAIDVLTDNSDALASPFFTGGWPGRNGVNNAFIAATPEHPWIVECCERLKDRDPSVPLSMGSRHVSSVLASHPEVTVLDRKAIYQNPAWHDGIERLRPPGHPWRRDIYAIHHFSYLWHPTGFETTAGTETGR